MAKVTEKSLKARCTELNLGALKNTTFGIRFNRSSKGYTVELQYRDSTPPQILVADVTASEASAAVEGAAVGAAAVQVAGLDKPEFVTRETFVRQAGERCPKCQTKDISAKQLTSGKGLLTQQHSCQRCGLSWNSIFRLDDYEAAVAVAIEV
jgi:DNA-directed RNA polymerase subunit M/transcription elongation factor TFIIS